MEGVMSEFLYFARLVCPQSDPSKAVHFLSRQYSRQMSTCFICENSGTWYWYHLHCDTCNIDIHKHCHFRSVCRMSDLAKPHTLQARDGELDTCIACGGSNLKGATSHYHCATSNSNFHEVCHLYPPEIKHPFHPSHPLKLTFSSASSYSDLKHLPTSWRHEPSDFFESETEEPDASNDVSISDVRCKCCQRHLQEVYYHCSICNFSLKLTCTWNPPPLTLLNIKSHEHTLTVFPRRIPLPCDACGLSLNHTNDLVYACLPCNFMVHRACIYLPRVIKITRHPHRLSLSASLPSGLFRCGVCRHTINVTYGQFSCQKRCHYAVHSRCAVEGIVWDGKDLEGVPEEPEEDVEPFVRIDDETIKHFSHDEHCLIFHGNNDVCDENKFCQACIIPILVSESFYGCMPCNFLLHEACASLPRKKDHPLHRHPLMLHPVPLEPFESENIIKTLRGDETHKRYIEGMFKCNGCDQSGYGFVYKCCEGCKFQLDTRCASLPDPFIHESHTHELFFNLTQGECMGCKSSKCSPFSFECMECKSFLGLKCATLPTVTHYKHDRHPITLCCGEKDTTNGQYWCEICEATLDSKEWFYTCNDYCNITVHVNCLLGKMFLKPTSFRVTGGSALYWILHNSSNTRAICSGCYRRCAEPFFFQVKHSYYCSLYCIWENEVFMYQRAVRRTHLGRRRLT